VPDPAVIDVVAGRKDVLVRIEFVLQEVDTIETAEDPQSDPRDSLE
jgi:hypothetical protein